MPPAPPAHAETSGMAVASLVFGCLFFILPAAIVAIILGHLSKSEIAKSAGRLKGAGMALAGLILGYVGVAFIPFLLIGIAILIPISCALESRRTKRAPWDHFARSQRH